MAFLRLSAFTKSILLSRQSNESFGMRREDFVNREKAVTEVVRGIHIYNQDRPHSSAAMKTPIQYELDLASYKFDKSPHR